MIRYDTAVQSLPAMPYNRRSYCLLLFHMWARLQNAIRTTDCPAATNPSFHPVPAFCTNPGLRRSSNAYQAYGPKDRIEWNVSAFWHWFGLYLCGGIATGAAWSILRLGDTLPYAHNWWLLCLVLALFGGSFCVLRLRRLYLYFAAERRPWWLSAGTVCALILLPLALREYQFQQSVLHLQQIEAQADEREQQIRLEEAQTERAYVEEERVRQERLRAEASQSRIEYVPTPARTYNAPATPTFNSPARFQSRQSFGSGYQRQSGSFGNSEFGRRPATAMPGSHAIPPYTTNRPNGGFGGGGLGGGGLGNTAQTSSGNNAPNASGQGGLGQGGAGFGSGH